MNYKALFLVCLFFASETQSLFSMDSGSRGKQYDTVGLVTTALGVLGLGGLGWYWYNAQRNKKKEALDKQRKTEESLFYALTASTSSSPQDLQQLERLLASPNININAPERSFGNTPLMNSVKAHNAVMVDFLLKHGALVRLKNLDNESALSLAYKLKENTIREMLEKHQAKLEQEFLDAAHKGDIQRIQELVPAVDINVQSKQGETALFEAIRHNHAALIKFLLDHGANPYIFNANKESILFPAINASKPYEDPELLNFLLFNYLYRGELNLQNKDGNTPLMYAVGTRKPAAVKALLDRGAKTDLRNESGYSVFDIAESPGINKEEKSIINLLKPYSWTFPVRHTEQTSPKRVSPKRIQKKPSLPSIPEKA